MSKTTSRSRQVSQNRLSLVRKIRNYYLKFLQIASILTIGLVIFFVKSDFCKNYRLEILDHLRELRREVLPWQLTKISITGNKYVPDHEIIALLNADIGTNIFDIDINNSLDQLQKNDWVKAAIIKRILPHEIYIEILERSPIAIWQYNQQLNLIDENGYVIHVSDVTKFAYLPHVVGQDAALHTQKLLDYLTESPEITANLISAVRYGGRRWNLLFEGNMTVKMPEDTEFSRAWKYLQLLYSQGKLFSHELRTLDLRDNQKYFIEYNNAAIAQEPQPKKKAQ